MIAAGAPVIGKIMGGGLEASDAGVTGEVETSQIAGGVGVIYTEETGVEEKSGEVRWVQRLARQSGWRHCPGWRGR